MQKTSRQLERYLKGVANHRRIDILHLVSKEEGIVLWKIAEILNCNMKTISEHVRRLVQAGLVEKRYQGQGVEHKLTPEGKVLLRFLKTF